MTKTIDFCNTGVGRRQKVRRKPLRDKFFNVKKLALLFAVNWDPLMCCIYQ